MSYSRLQIPEPTDQPGEAESVNKPPARPFGRRYTDSSSFRMALLFTLSLGLAAGILAYFTYQFNTSSLIREVEMAIDADLASFKDWQEVAPFLPIPNIIDRMRKHRQRSVYSYQNANGEYVYGSLVPDDLEVSELKEDILLLSVDHKDLRSTAEYQGTHRFAAKIHRLDDGTKLLIARDIEDALQQRTRMQQLGLLTILLMLIVICSSFFISTYIVGLTNRIGNTAKEIIATGDFSQRISVGPGWDDLSNLAAVLNNLFEKTESLMRSVRQVSDNIAHDLRTPLTRLRNQLEELDSSLEDDGCQDSQKSTQLMILEADHILGTFGALLRIARIESGKRERDFERVELGAILGDILELYQPLAEDKGIEVQADIEPHACLGDPDMLFQLFANLMDNAIKFTPPDGTISLSCRRQKDRICIEIADSGAGISVDDRSRIFDRFYRAEESRNTPGNGLGLSLVQAVLTQHRGEIRVEDNNPGARFNMCFKCLDSRLVSKS